MQPYGAAIYNAIYRYGAAICTAADTVSKPKRAEFVARAAICRLLTYLDYNLATMDHLVIRYPCCYLVYKLTYLSYLLT